MSGSVALRGVRAPDAPAQPDTTEDRSSEATVVGGVVARSSLFERVGGTARVTQVVAPAGSGKTVMLRSWLDHAGLTDNSAWVPAKPDGLNPRRFWNRVADALRGTAAAADLVRPLPEEQAVDGWTIVERLVSDLATLTEPVWLVIDDAHELAWDDALRQVERLAMRAPSGLRLVLASRHDLRLNLHCLRLEGLLTEIRAADLHFSVDEARALLESVDVRLSEPALARLHTHTEGWAAGLRLAAMSMTGHPDPERFAAEFSGSERTVADYLLGEVLEQQPDEVQRLLLRTSVLNRVNGELADLMSGGTGGHRTLQQLEAAGAFVTSTDAARSWFRIHRLFADLLQVELRRIAPKEHLLLHATAAEWFAAHGHTLEAIQHAQAAQAWEYAAQLLADHWVDLELDGRGSTAHQLLAAFPAGAIAADPELAVLSAGDHLVDGSRAEGERQLEVAAALREAVRPTRRGRFELLFAVASLSAARQRGDLATLLQRTGSLREIVEATEATQLGFGEDLRASALINIGIAETHISRLKEAEQHVEEAGMWLDHAHLHLDQGVALARRTRRPYLELVGLAWGAVVVSSRGLAAEPRCRQAIELAERYGYEEDQAAARAYVVLAHELVARGRLADAEPWLCRAAEAVRPGLEPALAVSLHCIRGMHELAAGRGEKALADFRAGGSLATGTSVAGAEAAAAAGVVLSHAQLGRLERAAHACAQSDERHHATLELRIARAALELARRDPAAATAALGPAIDGSIRSVHAGRMVSAFLLEAIARDELGDSVAAGRALEHALDIAEPEHWILPFLLHPASALLERHGERTAHPALIIEIVSHVTGAVPADPRPAAPDGLREPLSNAEVRVLRYLPTGLSVPEIARELYVSANTVRTHLRHIYDKLDTHRRHEAIERARALGLISSPRR